jgi:hypothetical protein
MTRKASFHVIERIVEFHRPFNDYLEAKKMDWVTAHAAGAGVQRHG